jgi:TonB-dependent SusC/RagA subfamily outer membrane receptor
MLFSWLATISQEPGEITICWDVSGSMRGRDLEKELDYLSSFFGQLQDASVTLLIFSNRIWGAEQFEIRSGNWSELQNRLKNQPYDGATSYGDLPAYSKTGDVLLFTDGNHNLEETTPVFDAPLHIINSSPDFNTANLNLLALFNEAELVNLAERKAIPALSPVQPYYGKVYGEIPDYSILALRIKGGEGEVWHPDSLGNYSIPASPGDILILEFNSEVAAQQELGNARNINIWIEDSGLIKLNEVVVADSRKESEHFTVKTSMGEKNRDAVGYTAPGINEGQITEVETNAGSAVQGKFSGVRLGQNDQLSQVEIRSRWSVLSNNYGLVVIDGVPMSKSNSSVYSSGSSVSKAGFIDPKNIADITVLKGLAATNRFGSLGANGVILITTKAGDVPRPGIPEKKDLALLKDNIYDGKIRVNKETLTTAYLKELKNSKDVSSAYELYLNQRREFEDRDAYFIDVFEFFRDAEPELALRILTNILEKEDPGWPALRALLFKARELDDSSLEYQVAQRLLHEYPGKVQSYLDIARAQQSSGNYQLALNTLLAILDGNAQRELDFTPLKKTVERDLANLVSLHSATLDLGRLPAKYRNNIQYNARISFEWNEPGASFELQFVNPQKRFFTWAHGAHTDARRFKTELEHGFCMEEFEIFGPGVEGEWIINVRYSGNGQGQADAPVFLNGTITYNFGKPGQHSKQYVLRLHEAGSETQLAKIELE